MSEGESYQIKELPPQHEWRVNHSCAIPQELRKLYIPYINFAIVLAYLLRHHPDRLVQEGREPLSVLSIGAGNCDEVPSLCSLVLPNGEIPQIRYIPVDKSPLLFSSTFVIHSKWQGGT